MGARLSPEERLLLLGARVRADEPARRTLGEILSAPLDWNRVLERSHEEGTSALLHLHVSRAGDIGCRIPPAVLSRLAGIRQRLWARNTVLVERWAEVMGLLSREGIPCITHKGIALIHTVYPEIGVRPMADIDLLVRPADVPAVKHALEAAGYRTHGSVLEDFESHRSFLLLIRESTLIDLHWHLAHYTRFEGAVDVDHEGLWRRARPFVAGGTEGLTLSLEDTLLHLALHLTLGSEFGRLIWFSDIDALVGLHLLDWERVLDEAVGWRVRTILGYTLNVAHASLETPVPLHVRERLGPRGLRRALLGACVGVTCPPSLAGGIGDSRIYLGETLLMDRIRHVARVLWTSLFPSSTWIRLHYALTPGWRVALYRVLHPLRVCFLAVRHLR